MYNTIYNDENLLGKQFGKLTVIEEIPKDQYRRWKCICICGTSIITSSYQLLKGLSKSCGIVGCGRNNRIPDLIGKRFGKLIVKDRIKKTNSLARQGVWLCVCDCGGTREVTTCRLQKGGIKDCGCDLDPVKYKDRTLPVKKDLFKNHYQYRTKKKNLPFELTFDEFVTLADSNCYYCGAPPSNERIQNKQYKTISRWVYNGIDRKDNSLGYTVENCVPCCFSCNNAKSSRTLKEFVELGIKLSKNLRAKYEKHQI